MRTPEMDGLLAEDCPLNTGVIVLGMHRGGTSAVASAVTNWGAFGWPAETLPADEWNPRGYFELRSLVSFDSSLLHAVGAAWCLPPSSAQSERLSRLAGESPHSVAARRLLAEARRHRVWVWKDPRLPFLLPFWQRLWSSVRYVIVCRHPADVAASLRTRDGMPISLGHLLWREQMGAILRAHLDRASVHIVCYERLIETPARECQRLADFLSQSILSEATAPARVERMVAGIDPALRRHNHATPSTLGRHSRQEALYRSLIDDPGLATPIEPSSCEEGTCERDLCATFLTLNRVMAELSRAGLTR